MIAMQYTIQLPDDFDMTTIRQRVHHNGHKTDGFPDLLMKAYLIQENNEETGAKNRYAPFYLWEKQEGMNQFIFDGFYDNILRSFGWQHIAIGIPYDITIDKESIHKSRYVLILEHAITPSDSMSSPSYTLTKTHLASDALPLGKILVYNPDKWQYAELYFYETAPTYSTGDKLFEILHLSGEHE